MYCSKHYNGTGPTGPKGPHGPTGPQGPHGLLDPRDLMGFLVLERGEEDVVTDNYITHCEGEAFEHCRLCTAAAANLS